MMTLAQASSYFDRTAVTDPYTGQLLFRAQVDPFDDSKRDAYSAYRRVMSVAPGIEMPAHRTVNLLGADWIVGYGESDGMENLHRQKFVITQANAELKISTLGQYLSGASSATVKAAAYWSKDAKQVDTSSEQPQMYDVFVPRDVSARSLLWNATDAYLCVSARPMASGMTSGFSLKLTHRVETASVSLRAYSPREGQFTTTTTVNIPVLQVRWQSLFEYDAQLDARYQEGDISLVMPASPQVLTSTLVELATASYQVLGVDIVGDAQVAHCRRV